MDGSIDKYFPTSVNELVGDMEPNEKIIEWFKQFEKRKLKSNCLIITGGHGVGKTCRIKVIAKHLGYEIKTIKFDELKEAPDETNYLKEILSDSNILRMLGVSISRKNIVIIDDANTILSSIEKKLVTSIIEINNKLNQMPLIFIFNNTHNKLLGDIKKYGKEIHIEEPSEFHLKQLLTRICYMEKLKFDTKETAIEIIHLAQNDMRRMCIIMNDMKNECSDHKIRCNNVEKYKQSLCMKECEVDLFRSTSKLLHEYTNISNCLKAYDNDKVTLPSMINQNYMKNLTSTKDDIDKIMNISESLSFGDIIEGYIYSEQCWDLTKVHGFYSCVYPSYWINKCHQNGNTYPSFINDLNRTSVKNNTKKTITNLANKFETKDITDYLYMKKIIKHVIDTDNQEYLNKIAENKISIDILEDIIKIDKMEKNSLKLTSKQRKILK